jgi:hypothetical protein
MRGKTSVSIKFLFAGFGFMLLSSLGPLSLPLFSKVAGQNSPLYSNAIQFYLHFQFNGWFIFGILALLFKQLEKERMSFSKTKATLFFRSLLVSCILTYFLSMLKTHPNTVIYILAAMGSFIQIFSFILFISIINPIKKFLANSTARLLAASILAVFGFKVILQALSAVPAIADSASGIRHFTVAFIHLVVLGMITPSIFLLHLRNNFLNGVNAIIKTGIRVFLAGFFLTEVLAFSEGTANYFLVSIPHYYLFQLIFSFLIFCGIALTYLGRNKLRRLSISKLQIHLNLITNSKLQS